MKAKKRGRPRKAEKKNWFKHVDPDCITDKSPCVDPELTKKFGKIHFTTAFLKQGDVIEDTVVSDTILQEAQKAVYGDRQADYGSVTENFNNIAGLWSVILGNKITAEQVGLAMIAVKMARQMHKPKRDSLVDICGYSACLEKMENGL